jgi:hypothetical protein
MALSEMQKICTIARDVSSVQDFNISLGSDSSRYEFYSKLRDAFKLSEIPLERAAFVDDFHVFMFGANPSVEWRNAMTITLQTSEALVKLYKPQNAIIADAPAMVPILSQIIPEVTILNNFSTAALAKFCNTSNINNVSTITYDQLDSITEQYDSVIVLMGLLYNEELLKNFMRAVKPGGVLLITNGSNGGRLYESEVNQVHLVYDTIKENGSFSIYHVASPVAFAICIKDV